MISVHRLSARFGDFTLGPIDFEAPEGAYIALVGPSGHGKTSLLWSLTGTVPCGGEIHVGGDWTRLPPQERSIALVPQAALPFSHLNVGENIGYALPRGSPRVTALAESWGVSHLLPRFPAALSGGESMRVALARALGRDPALLLLDEPLSAIDEAGKARLLAQLRALRGTRTVIHVTHDLDEAASLATHLGVLRAGKLEAFGAIEQVLLHPPTPEVAAFLGAENLLAGAFAPHGEDASVFETGGITLHVLAHAQGRGYVSIPERAVTLSLLPPHDVSARNAIAGRVSSIVCDRFGARVEVCGAIRIFARLERESVSSLHLETGTPIFALIKSAQIRVVAAER